MPNAAKTGRTRDGHFVAGLWACAWVLLGTYLVFGRDDSTRHSGPAGAVLAERVGRVPGSVSAPHAQTPRARQFRTFGLATVCSPELLKAKATKLATPDLPGGQSMPKRSIPRRGCVSTSLCARRMAANWRSRCCGRRGGSRPLGPSLAGQSTSTSRKWEPSVPPALCRSDLAHRSGAGREGSLLAPSPTPGRLCWMSR